MVLTPALTLLTDRRRSHVRRITGVEVELQLHPPHRRTGKVP